MIGRGKMPLGMADVASVASTLNGLRNITCTGCFRRFRGYC